MKEISKIANDVALLAPVPLKHLGTGLKSIEVCGKVAFGTNAIGTFLKLDELRDGELVDAYIYATHSGEVPVSYWRARYIGYVGANNDGIYPYGAECRPLTTMGDTPFLGFWEVKDLKEVEERDWGRLAEFTGLTRKKPYGRFFVPEGPIIVRHPGTRTFRN